MAERVVRGRRAVRLVEPGADGVTWWCEVRGVAGETVVGADAVPAGAEPDSWWIAEVARYDDDSVVVLRLTAPFDPHGEEPDPAGAPDEPGAIARPDRPRARERSGVAARDRARLACGTVVVAHIGFTGTPGRVDANRWGKDRPCVVVADHGDVVEVQPLSTSAGRAGRDHAPVRDWHAAGLTERTWLDPRTCFVPPDDLGAVIGRLAERDLPLLNPPRR